MAEATFNFPRGFMWGTATSSHQVEGNNHNNTWWAWEQEPGRIAGGDTSGLACDWWGGRWRQDFDRAAESGQNAHRLSIEWSRVQPKPNRWNEAALDRYRQMLRGLHERGMRPVVTLHHFSDPLWLAEQGGWENPRTITHFAVYASRVVEALKSYADIWVTINEPNVFATLGYVLGLFPPGKRDLNAAFQVMTNMAKAHASTYHAIHAIQPQAQVGLAVNYRGFDPARPWFPPDQFSAGLLSRLYNNFFPQAAKNGDLRFITKHRKLPQAKNTLDFLGINYYTAENVSFAPLSPAELFCRRAFPVGADLSPSGDIANRPEGLFHALKWGLGFGVPIIVTENGVEDSADRLRPRYLAQHIRHLWRAVNFNYPIKGYFHWSLVDNFEWHNGWTQRFGLWELDTETQARRKRSSADLYAAICKQNALSSEMVAKFAPELLKTMFPG
ncbi:MAG: glycoside hydrolase family 1 protein [Anaerolineae bacterium]|nr:glycoside hydrolase family 1 protein [Anaerolineae bacterium]